jgi:hypothetical protein
MTRRYKVNDLIVVYIKGSRRRERLIVIASTTLIGFLLISLVLGIWHQKY